MDKIKVEKIVASKDFSLVKTSPDQWVVADTTLFFRNEKLAEVEMPIAPPR